MTARTSRELFSQLGWSVSTKAAFRIIVEFGDGSPPFASGLGCWTASLHLRSAKDEPDWSVGVWPPGGGGTEIWEGEIVSDTLGVAPLTDLAAFPDWMRAIRERSGGVLSVAFIDAGRNAKAAPEIARWLGWETTVLAASRAPAADAQSLLDWANAVPPTFYAPKDLAAQQKLVPKLLAASSLPADDLRPVADRVVKERTLFLQAVLAAKLPPPARSALSVALGDASRFQAAPLQHGFLSIALRIESLEAVSAYFKVVCRFSSRLRALLDGRAKIPITPALVEAAREACLGFELPSYMPACTNDDASVFLLLAMDGTDASASALRRIVGLFRDAGRSDVEHHEAVARAIATHTHFAAFLQA